MQEKDVRLITSSLGQVKIFTRESYKQEYNRDPITDDNMTAESWVSPSGASLSVFKALSTHTHIDTLHSLTLTHTLFQILFTYFNFYKCLCSFSCNGSALMAIS